MLFVSSFAQTGYEKSCFLSRPVGVGVGATYSALTAPTSAVFIVRSAKAYVDQQNNKRNRPGIVGAMSPYPSQRACSHPLTFILLPHNNVTTATFRDCTTHRKTIPIAKYRKGIAIPYTTGSNQDRCEYLVRMIC